MISFVIKLYGLYLFLFSICLYLSGLIGSIPILLGDFLFGLGLIFLFIIKPEYLIPLLAGIILIKYSDHIGRHMVSWSGNKLLSLTKIDIFRFSLLFICLWLMDGFYYWLIQIPPSALDMYMHDDYLEVIFACSNALLKLIIVMLIIFYSKFFFKRSIVKKYE